MWPPIAQTVGSGQPVEHVGRDLLDGRMAAAEEAGPVGGGGGEYGPPVGERAQGGSPVAHPPPARLGVADPEDDEALGGSVVPRRPDRAAGAAVEMGAVALVADHVLA